jgi:DNA-binding transcriptional ArsR family regulator
MIWKLGDADPAFIGAVLADARRCRMLAALGDGRALAATALAIEAGVAPSTASEHLARLCDSHLVVAEQRGRHRYYRLAGPEVGELLEVIARLAPPLPVRSLTQGTRAEALRRARTCYDHLAGRLGVALMDAFLERGVIEAWESSVSGVLRKSSPSQSECGYMVTERGKGALAALGMTVESSSGRRPLVRSCLDWSEQQPHIAGMLGASLAHRLFELRWLARSPKSRAVLVTEEGGAGLRCSFGIVLD